MPETDRIDIEGIRRELKKQIADRHRFEGQATALMERLRAEFKIDSLDEARAKLQELNAEVEKLEAQLVQALDELDQYAEDDDG